jgi:hypothetical protein
VSYRLEEAWRILLGDNVAMETVTEVASSLDTEPKRLGRAACDSDEEDKKDARQEI